MKEIKFRFEKYNPNPFYEKDKKYTKGDCVIRAICKVTGLGWYEVYDLLCAKGRAMCDFGNQKEVYEAVLSDLGFQWVVVKREKRKKAETVESFMESHQQGGYILRLAHHLTAVVDGVNYDAWYPQGYSVYGYWTKK